MASFTIKDDRQILVVVKFVGCTDTKPNRWQAKSNSGQVAYCPHPSASAGEPTDGQEGRTVAIGKLIDKLTQGDNHINPAPVVSFLGYREDVGYIYGIDSLYR